MAHCSLIDTAAAAVALAAFGGRKYTDGLFQLTTCSLEAAGGNYWHSQVGAAGLDACGSDAGELDGYTVAVAGDGGGGDGDGDDGLSWLKPYSVTI